MNEQVLTVEEMKATLVQTIGFEQPLSITKKNKETMTGFIRGFADLACNILLVSDKIDSLSMRIVEIRNINQVVYPHHLNNSPGARILRAK